MKRTNIKGKIAFSLILTVVMIIGLLPQMAMPVFAADPMPAAMNLGTSGIQTGDHIYYGATGGGTNPLYWRVLDAEKMNTGASGMFLMSEYLLGAVRFSSEYVIPYTIFPAYKDSEAKAWCTSYANTNFSSAEFEAIAATSKDDSAFNTCYAVPGILEGDKLFFLSMEEAFNSAYGFVDNASRVAKRNNASGNIDYWWIRSDTNGSFANWPTLGLEGQVIFVSDAYKAYAQARPAFNLDSSALLFTSAATGGKSSGEVGSDALQAVSSTSPGDRKLTLIDNSRSFSVTQTTASAVQGDKITFNYADATGGANEYVSAMIVDGGNNVLYYGRMKAISAGSESGTLELTIPASIPVGSYTLKMFSEQMNGDKKTDFASAPENIELTVPDTTAPTVSSVTPVNNATGISIDGSIVINFDEAMDTTFGTVQLNSLEALTGGSWSNGNKTYTVAYTGLLNNTSYTIKVSGFKDAAGNDLAEDTSKTFTTVPDTTAPTVSGVTPANNATGISIDGSIVINFDEVMDTTFGTVQLNSLEALTGGSWSNGNKTYTVAYTGLLNNTSYTIKVSGFKDAAGNDLAEDTSKSFTTVPDTTAPTVSSVTPVNNATGISIDGSIVINFDEVMDTTFGTVQLNSLEALTGGSWSNGNKTYTVAYTGLLNNTSYTIKVSGFKDAAGNDLAEDTSKSFTTVPDTTAPTLTAGVVIRTSDTAATVIFTSNEAGAYYYNIGSAVTDTSTDGIVCVTGKTTISLTNLLAGARDIYIVVKDGGGNVSADSFKITIPAYTAGTYSVSGIATENAGSAVSGASVRLMKGNTPIGMQGVTTDSSGEFTIVDVPNGTYNLIVSKDGIIVTTIITVSGSDYAAGTIELPTGKRNSVVEVTGSNTPKIVIGNLDGQFSIPATDNDKGITADDNVVVTSGGSVEIKLTAEKKDGTAANASNISTMATADGKTVGIFIDLSVLKTVRNSSGDEIASQSAILAELPSLIDVFIPLPTSLQGRENYVVYRYHGTEVNTITTEANSAGEKIELINGGTTIKLTIKKFSTYAIAYTTPSTPTPTPIVTPTNNTGGSSGGGSNSSVVAPTITAETSEGGKITISTDKKTATITPDDGYVIADAVVDGKSIGATEKYTFTDSKTHKIKAVFVKKSALVCYNQENQKIYIGFSSSVGNLYKYVAPTGVTVEFKENPKTFTDNTIAWAKPSIDFVTEREIFLGTDSDKFSPNESMTRAMIVTAIGRLYERSYGSLSGNGSVSGTSTFSDVNANDYYAKYVVWANENGLIKGVGENLFAPNEKVTREQMAVVMLNFASYLKKTEATGSSLAYADSASISTWATDGAKYCQETKVITGREGGSFMPQGNATRAEVAAVIERFVKTILK